VRWLSPAAIGFFRHVHTNLIIANRMIIFAWHHLQELEAMRQQAQIWSDVSSSEVEKMRAVGELLTGQLAARSAELAALRQQLTDVEAERDRALQERQQVGGGKALTQD
jgi:hypothetical protein